MKKTKVKQIPFNMTDPIYMSFFAAFLALSGTTVITFLATFTETAKENRYLRSALISETCVNVIAGFAYAYFMKYLYEQKLALEDVTSVRYLDWFLTTPLLLVSFALFASYSYDKTDKIDLTPLTYIIVFNLLMLYFGFMGETGKMSRYPAFFLGFISYGLLMYFLYESYVKDKGSANENVFYVFVGVWAMYGFAYLMDVQNKNITYNILDIISKAGFGMLIWLSVTNEGPTTS